MALNRSSKQTIILVVAGCAVAAILFGSSAAQVTRNKPAEYEEAVLIPPAPVGRFQMVQTTNGIVIFDTKTAEYWQRTSYTGPWQKHLPPWEKPAN
jgi:hypothetical protein